MIYLFMFYVYLALHRPMEIWPALEPFRIELIYFGFVCVAWLVAGKRLTVQLPQLAILGMAMAVYLSWMLSPWAAHGEIAIKNFTFVFVFGLLLSTAVRDERSLHRLIVAFIGVLALYMLHSLWEYRNGRHTYRMGISRLIGVDLSLGDPNTFGATLVYALPFVRYLWITWEPGWRRKLLVFYVLLSVGCIGLTGSRSSLLGLGAWATLTLLLTGRRKLPLLLGFVIVAVTGFAMLPQELQLRFTTIIDPTVGPENAKESGQGRIEGFFLGLGLWQRFPLTGCGPGAWLPATKRAIESHNLFGQTVGELGTVGLIAFVFMVGVIFGWCRKLTRLIKQNDPEPKAEPLYHLAQAIAVSTVLLLALGLFGHNLYRYNYTWYCAFLTIAVRCYQERLAAEHAPAEGWSAAWA